MNEQHPPTTIDEAWNRLPGSLRDRIRIHQHGCWVWTGHLDAPGYPIAKTADFRGKRVHRVTYELCFGPLGSNHAHHKCHVPACVNPFHIESKPVGFHYRDHKTSEACKNGHAWTVDNTEYVTRRTGRYKEGIQMRRCVACRRIAHRELMRKWRAERRLAA